MAIWQKEITVVPSVWGILPKLDTKSYHRYEKAWRKLNIDYKPIVDQIDSFIARSDWVRDKDYFSWKGDDTNDNDAEICIDPKLDIIISFSFRFDLRITPFKFLEDMCTICSENEWKLETLDGQIFDSEASIIPKL